VSRRAARPGFAAPLALCMLAAVAALAAASFHAVVQGRRSATRFRGRELTASAADVGLASLLASWDVAGRDSLAIGGVDSSAPHGHGQRAGTHTLVTRITSRLFWVEVAAQIGTGTSVEARTTHHLLLEVRRPDVFPSAALISRGDVLVGPDAAILFEDSPPPGWLDCPAPDSSGGYSVLVPQGVAARMHDGVPIPGAIAGEAAGRAETYEQPGEVSAAELAARADVTLAPGAILSQGRDSATARIVHGAGDLIVTSGAGQGVLLVDGLLSIRGPFRFAGVVIARGGIDASGHGVSIYGAVLSAGPEGVSWHGSGVLRRSTCAVRRAVDAAARPFVVGRRGWAELF
jgi:hypothetical protein